MADFVTKCGKKAFSMVSHISPSFSSRLLFLMRTHKWPNLKNPKSFNEKTTWLKLNDYNHNELVSKCADKYAVREYVESKGCGEILNELYGVYDDFDEIDFSKLPKEYALKCTHGCAYNIIVDKNNPLDIIEARKKVRAWQKEKYGYATTELQYVKISPRIIVEKYLCDKNGKMPLDYKFYCMNGEVKCVLVCSERDEKLRLSYYDLDWNRLPYEKDSWSSKKDIDKPKNFRKMIEYAKKLSGDFPFVRVDLYNDNGKIIFGELTFTPACCCAPYYSEVGNRELGKMLELSFRCEVLVSVMNQRNYNPVIKRLKIGNKEKCVIINQITHEKEIPKDILGDIKFLSVRETGLSRSRNLALKNATGDVLILADDDMELVRNYQKIINDAYKKYPNADIIAFDYVRFDKTRKTMNGGKVGFLRSMKLSSAQITFKRNSLNRSGIVFDVNFGTGSGKNNWGEENIFLFDCLRAGLKIYYVPLVLRIVSVNSASTWDMNNTVRHYEQQGAIFCRMSLKYWRILVIQYAIRKRRLYNRDMRMLDVYKAMVRGAKEYRRDYLNA